MELTPIFAALIPVTIGIVAAVRAAGLPSRLAPLFSILVGICLAVLAAGYGNSIVLYGIVVGISASGTYSAVKTTLGLDKPSPEPEYGVNG